MKKTDCVKFKIKRSSENKVNCAPDLTKCYFNVIAIATAGCLKVTIVTLRNGVKRTDEDNSLEMLLMGSYLS